MTITQHTRRRVSDAITPKGTTQRELSLSSGVHISNVRMIVRLLDTEGKVFTMRAGTGEGSKHEVWVFPTAQAREEFEDKWLDEVARRQKARLDAKAARRKSERESEGRSRIAIAAERREARKRVERERAEESARLEKLKLESKQAKLRAETKAAGAMPKPRGTANPKPAPRGPAYVQGVPDNSNAKVTKLDGCPASRWDTTGAAKLFSQGRYGEYPMPVSRWAEAAAA
jgi:hypothetical protein